MGNNPILFESEACTLSSSAFRTALTRILRPIVRTMIDRGRLFPEISDLLKELYVEGCATHFELGQKRLTDSRISLLTGLQRKDIRAIRARLENAAPRPDSSGAGQLPRVIARWLGGAPYSDGAGTPRALLRLDGTNDASFEALVSEVSRDIHPRTVLDELRRQGLIRYDEDTDTVILNATAFVPSGEESALLGYFGANLGDHAEAAAGNIAAAPQRGPNFERAVHYNQLTPQSLAELEELARSAQSQILSDLNAVALTLQKRDAKHALATGRFRCGAYVYRSRHDEPGENT